MLAPDISNIEAIAKWMRRALVRTRAPSLRRANAFMEYPAKVRRLIAALPIDQAMSAAVGGDYDATGKIEAEIMQATGLKSADSLIDLGCGSGRLAKHIGAALPDVDYLGIDIVQELLDYATTQSPPHFRFMLNRSFAIPADDASADFVTAFSVFTHLFHEESYAYLCDIRRVLKPSGKIVFSFLETGKHWPVFESLLASVGASDKARELVMFIERPQVLAWAEHLNMSFEGFDPGPALGQTVAVLRK